MEIVTAKSIDSKILSEIHAKSWKGAYEGVVPKRYLDELPLNHWEKVFDIWLGGGTVTAKIAYKEDKAVGCVLYGHSRIDKLPYWGEIISLYVLPEYFRKGYGRSLINEAFNDLRKQGYEAAYLWVLQGNDRAEKFYEKIGFVPTDDTYEVELAGQKLIDFRYDYKL